MKLLLSKLKWFNRGEIWVTGSILYGNRFLKDEELLNYFSHGTSLCEFEASLKNADGQFSVIIKRGDEVWVAVDRLRHRPLFYTLKDGEFAISDDCYKLAELRSENQFDQDALNSFLASGYVINDHTLIRDIKQVEAGSIVSLGGDVRISFYHDPAGARSESRDINSATEELVSLLDKVFKKYFEALKNKFIAIPLSGGYDSRLVALMASKYHPENVLCYTYGRKNNPETILAQEVAQRLGLKWISVVYDAELIKGFIQDNFFESYYPWVSDLTSMFFLQEYFSVRYLKSQNLIPENSVFISGYSGDFIAGSYITPAMWKNMDNKDISELIFKDYFRLIRTGKEEKLSICDLIEKRIPAGRSEAWKVIEAWDLKERHSKFIINSAKVFTFFGYEYVFPLWDNRLVDLMLSQPLSLRMNRKLYEHALRDHIFNANNLNLLNETNPPAGRKRLQRFKESVKPFLPAFVKNRFIDLKSTILYDEITGLLIEDIGNKTIVKPLQPNYYNSYITQWYIIKTAERLHLRLTL